MNICKYCGIRDVTGPHSGRCRPCRKIFDASRDSSERSGNSPSKNWTDAAKARKRRYVETHGIDATKAAARRAVRNAVKRGQLQRPSACDECGRDKQRIDGVSAIQAHHDDYSKPLAVRWLCARCHKAHHIKDDAAISKER